MIIAIDLDDVLAKTLDSFIEFHNKTYRTTLKFEDFNTYSLSKILGISEEEEAKRLELFDESNFFENLKPMDFSQKIISQLSQENEIIVITARTKNVEKKTTKWMSHYFPEIKEVVFISSNYSGHDKSKAEICKKLGVKVIIEDKTQFVMECAQEGIKVLLFDSPWNKNIKESPLITRVYSWEDIVKKIYNLN